TDIEQVLGTNVFKPWVLVNKPFEAEYPGERRWNLNAPQLRFSVKPDPENLLFPTWMKVLNHCGSSLDKTLEQHAWAKANSIKSGGEYLKCWLASIFQEPDQPLPYLFFYGPQNSGKSIFHEAFDLLVTHGCERADVALTNPQGFNAELENAILCVVEETDLRLSKVAYNRIKDWVTSRYLPVHKKGITPYRVKNTTHWIQCGNDHKVCPIFPGDTRITMCFVPSLEPLELIPKRDLLELLEKEATDLITELMNLELPKTNDRLNVPVVITDDKLTAEENSLSQLEVFIQEKCKLVHGHRLLFSDFYDRFLESLPPNEVPLWTKQKVSKEVPIRIPKGRLAENNQLALGNITFDLTANNLDER